MSLPLWKKVIVAAFVVCGFVTAPILLAQKPEAKPEAKPAAVAEKKPAKRLPAYFKDVVDGTQKEKVYAIQEKYDTQIAVLADQIKALQKQRDAEFESVLSAEQKTRLEKLRADAKAKALERAAAKKAAEAKTAEAAPAKPVAPATTTKAPPK